MNISKLVLNIYCKMLNSKRIGAWLRELVKSMYLVIAKADLPVKAEFIKVKKGKTRYILVFFKTKKGLTRVNIGRHKIPITTIFDEKAA